MNRQLFLKLLAHPDSVSESESIALKKFTENFPYCQTGRLLYVKHLHSQKSVHYPEQLKIAAAYAADRKVLYSLIHSTAKEVKVAEEQIPQPLSLRVEPELKENAEETIPSDALAADKSIEQVEQTSAEIISEKNTPEEPVSQTDIIQKRLQEIAASKASPPAPVQRREESASTESNEVEISAPEIIPVETSDASPAENIPEKIWPKKEEDLKTGKHSFTAWLKTVKKEPFSKPAKQEKTAPTPSSTNEIIDRFIETEPRIIPSKAEFYSPVKMAKQSLEEHDDLVSETLAGIFAEQGNLPRAIEMYRKLMLSNPEKSSFFAALVEKLTQQLNEDK